MTKPCGFNLSFWISVTPSKGSVTALITLSPPYALDTKCIFPFSNISIDDFTRVYEF